MINHILFHLMTNVDYTQRVVPYLKPEYFNSHEEKLLFKIIAEYFGKYSKVPNSEVIKVELEVRDIEEGTYNSSMELVESLESDVDNLDWLLERTEEYIQEKAIHNAIYESIEIIEGSDKKRSRGQIPELLSNALSVGLSTTIGHDYLADIAQRWDASHQSQKAYPTHLSILNTVVDSGFFKKTLNMVTATTGVGKTAFMCDLAAHYLMSGYNVVYITLEMAEWRIAQRIDANLLDIPLKELKKLNKEDFEGRLGRIKMKAKTGKLIIKEYPPVSVNSLHLESFLQEMSVKKNFKPDIIFVDYLNILLSSRYNGNGANSYTVVKSIAEELRSLMVKYDAVGFSATQLNRSGYGSTDVDMTSISESIGLPATVDSLFALISTPEFEERSQIMMKQLKNRYGDINYYNTFFIGIERAKMKFFDLENRQDPVVRKETKEESSDETQSSDMRGKMISRGRRSISLSSVQV